MFDLLVIGGGAAGFFTAIHVAEANPSLKIAVLERGKDVLSKVKISGGGRCNVTNAEFDPSELVKNYPRGEKELLGPFYNFGSADTVSFFEDRGIPLKREDDGRMFPVSNTSQTIIDLFLEEVKRLGILVLKHSNVIGIKSQEKENENSWQITSIKKVYECKKLLIASGSNPKIWKMIECLGHTIEPPTPSLFTFNIKDERIKGIPGVSTNARIEVFSKKVYGSKVTIKLKSREVKKPDLVSEGPLLITHWGVSGPAVLKLSAWGSKLLNEYEYKFRVRINWLPDYHADSVIDLLFQIKDVEAKKTVLRTKAVDIPRRLWTNLVRASGIGEDMKWAETTKELLLNLADQLTCCEFNVDGKSTFKDEFVTAGGVVLKEINFKTFESKLHPNLFFAGEVINVDGITGGFNFQNAWTTGYIAAHGIINS